MKKVILSIILIIGVIGFSFTEPVDGILAKKIAKNFYWERVKYSHNAEYSNISIELIYTKEVNGTDLYYIFNVKENDNNGFIIVAADDDVHPVLGFSLTHGFDADNTVITDELTSFAEWMTTYEAQILYVKQNALKADIKVTHEWTRLETLNETKTPQPTKAVGPLLTTQWSQRAYYNSKCPIEPNAPSWCNGHCPVGCVATAMAQVMKYHNHPIQGTGSHGYMPSGYGYQSANFGNTTYDWANMPNTISAYSSTAEIDAVSTLMFHCGVSIDIMYGVSATSGYTQSIPAALKNYFKYASTAQCVGKYSYTDANWETLLKTEIDNNRPMVYSGNGAAGGHAFVCDGYDASVASNYFHFNWGQCNQCVDGFYYLTSLTPNATYDFTNNQDAVIGVEPLTTSIVNNVDNMINVNVFPSPATDKLFVESNITEPLQLRLYNVLGKDVLDREIKTPAIVNVSDITKGIYFIEVSSRGNKTVKKMIIE